MRTFFGDIWEHRSFLLTKYINPVIVVPTNLGWNKQRENILGAGLAKQVKDKFPDIAKQYGTFCIDYYIYSDRRLYSIDYIEREDYKFLMFPTKKLIVERPHLSWRQDSDLETIEKSCKDLMTKIAIDKVNGEKEQTYLMPLVGCGNGKLSKDDVIPILEKYFKDDYNIRLILKG